MIDICQVSNIYRFRFKSPFLIKVVNCDFRYVFLGPKLSSDVNTSNRMTIGSSVWKLSAKVYMEDDLPLPIQQVYTLPFYHSVQLSW
jgi:hypothetical protein